MAVSSKTVIFSLLTKTQRDLKSNDVPCMSLNRRWWQLVDPRPPASVAQELAIFQLLFEESVKKISRSKAELTINFKI